MRKILYILLPVFILAQVNYVLKKDVLSAGGRKMTNTSANYVLQGTISQTTIGKVEDTNYKGIIGFWHLSDPIPPSAPYVDPVEKSGDDVVLTWKKITTDTLDNPETVHYYVVYRNTSPSFILGPSDSIGYVSHPDTVYTDIDALISSNSYYYLVKAVDWARNQSKKSNMGYKLNKFFNENISASNRNWVSLPWHSGYTTVSDLTDDLSSSGDPLEKIVNLRDDQMYVSWLWYPDFLMWFGDDFAITSGRGYEMVTIIDTTLALVGSNNPAGLISLEENLTATNRNWVSIPYNAVYNTVSDITTEYSPLGDPLEKIVNLRDDQMYVSWLWYPDFLMWFGDDFPITPGRGYEIVTIIDTTWNPTEYTNESGMMLLAMRRDKKSNIEVHLGKSTEPDRAPAWSIKGSVDQKLVTPESKSVLKKEINYLDADVYEPVTQKSKLESKKKTDYLDADVYDSVSKKPSRTQDYRVAGISHIVRAHLKLKDFENLVFTAYRPDRPYDVLTENVVGCGSVKKDSRGAVWFDVGNFKIPWQHEEEVILIIEAIRKNKGYFTVLNFKLDKGVDIQELDEISFIPIPEPKQQTALCAVCWDEIGDVNIVGYSLYKDAKRINENVISEKEYSVQGEISLKPVIIGGFETVYGSCQGSQSLPNDIIPISYSFNIYPNPFAKKTGINYALPQAAKTEIKVYDVGGRQVKTLVSEKLEPGYYKALWCGKDDIGRKVSAGVYFIRINTREFESRQKVIFVH